MSNSSAGNSKPLLIAVSLGPLYPALAYGLLWILLYIGVRGGDVVGRILMNSLIFGLAAIVCTGIATLLAKTYAKVSGFTFAICSYYFWYEILPRLNGVESRFNDFSAWYTLVFSVGLPILLAYVLAWYFHTRESA